MPLRRDGASGCGRRLTASARRRETTHAVCPKSSSMRARAPVSARRNRLERATTARSPCSVGAFAPQSRGFLRSRACSAPRARRDRSRPPKLPRPFLKVHTRLSCGARALAAAPRARAGRGVHGPIRQKARPAGVGTRLQRVMREARDPRFRRLPSHAFSGARSHGQPRPPAEPGRGRGCVRAGRPVGLRRRHVVVEGALDPVRLSWHRPRAQRHSARCAAAARALGALPRALLVAARPPCAERGCCAPAVARGTACSPTHNRRATDTRSRASAPRFPRVSQRSGFIWVCRTTNNARSASRTARISPSPSLVERRCCWTAFPARLASAFMLSWDLRAAARRLC